MSQSSSPVSCVISKKWAILDRKPASRKRGDKLSPYIGNGKGNMPDLYHTRAEAELACIERGLTPVRVVVTVEFLDE